MITPNVSFDLGCTNPILYDFWKRSHRPSFVDRTLLATLTTCTSHSVRLPKLSYLLSRLSEKDEHLPTDLPAPRYVNTRNEKAPHLGRPTAVQRIVFRSHLSSRSGITLPRWYTMTFISGFVRLGPWSFLSYPGILRGHSFRREPRAFVHSRNYAK